MCLTDRQVPGSVSEALRLADASLDLLNSPAADDLQIAAVGEVLTTLGALRAKLTAAHAALRRRFDAADGHDADGYATSSAWLAAKAHMTPRAARAAVAQMRQLTGRQHLHDALARDDISESWAASLNNQGPVEGLEYRRSSFPCVQRPDSCCG